MKSEILTFVQNNYDWENELRNEPYKLNIARKDQFAIFNYGIEPNFSMALVQEARGIILDVEKMEVVCFPFSKFFNYGESFAHDIDWSTAKIQEKIDGSLIKFWFNNYTNNWHVSTNKTIDAREAPVNERMSFYDLVQDAKNDAFNYFLDQADKKATHIFELTSPMNRIVIPYDQPQLWYLGSRTNETGKEYFNAYGLLTPKTYPLHTMQECLSELSNGHNGDIEGFVVVDDKFSRIKIKTEHYVKMARLRSNGNLTIKRILKIIEEGEKDEFLSYFSVYKDWFEEIEEKRNNMKKEILSVCAKAKKEFDESNGDRKKIALKYKHNPYFYFIFAFIDGKEIDEKQFQKKFLDFMT